MQDDLDDLFATARQRPPEPSAGLLARVLHDAEGVQDAQARPLRSPYRRRHRLLALVLGSAGAAAGMATAAVAGVWIGFAQPEAVSSVTAAWLADERVDLIPNYDYLTE
ncbi:dihydroorotate dehydrogenase [Falsirhodobacter deserti]|uniref:dihydroorotate dehydrogenase n=1 Tax=Falsirhodobacter deserti TaxID=1365611 RepID=UPI001F4E175B|nr:dihydroorotate dehydrogenase [Falsirhodobacter deserti]